ncbi:hypothetical protein [Oenococcus oeni]|uniref:hypothetical protein n=1 Tax=Oenococcus oeni TaxID=1247 RepID=UPI0008F86F2A|nr:hypothetical protein [Oenococcus oeni]OIM26462.1 hypothetical protein ATX61_05660 [Oenococcus oeni]
MPAFKLMCFLIFLLSLVVNFDQLIEIYEGLQLKIRPDNLKSLYRRIQIYYLVKKYLYAGLLKNLSITSIFNHENIRMPFINVQANCQFNGNSQGQIQIEVVPQLVAYLKQTEMLDKLSAALSVFAENFKIVSSQLSKNGNVMTYQLSDLKAQTSLVVNDQLPVTNAYLVPLDFNHRTDWIGQSPPLNFRNDRIR